MKNKSLLGSLLLLLTAFIWGSAFVAQSVGMDYLSPLVFNGTRCIIAGFVLLPVALLFDCIAKKSGTYKKPSPEEKKELLKGGAICGTAVFLASTIQQYGISMTTVGKSGFISVLYIIIVPFIGIFLHQKPPKRIWVCSLVALIGMYFLCINGADFSISLGDFIVFISAAAYAAHILCVDRFAARVNGVWLSCIQFIVAGTISFVLMLIFDMPTFPELTAAWLPLLYAGALSGAGAYTLQIIAQKWTPPSIASLVMSLESVFAVISGAIILHEIPTSRELIGSLLMFSAIIFVQLPEKKKSEEKAVLK